MASAGHGDRKELRLRVMEGNALESPLKSDPGELQSKPPTLEPAERRGRILAITVLGGLSAIPLYLEWLQLSPSDLMGGLGAADAVGIALRPVGISPSGWLRLALWSALLWFAFRGRGWARITVAVLAAIRGVFAAYYAVASGFTSDLAIIFLVLGVAYLLAALLLLTASDLVLFLARQRARS
jgi:hypothetical protein